ncbi:hypothetical protein BA060_02325 [Brucella sp. B13-0095]|nr:hypothetical protein BA060_02325 [Brucella sp. B13-0095]
MVWRESILFMNRRNDRRGVNSTRAFRHIQKQNTPRPFGIWQKNLHLGVAKPRWGNHPTFGFAPKAEDFLLIPNHKLIRHYSLEHVQAVIPWLFMDGAVLLSMAMCFNAHRL